jgi:hypothetical protein
MPDHNLVQVKNQMQDLGNIAENLLKVREAMKIGEKAPVDVYNEAFQTLMNKVRDVLNQLNKE